MQRRLPILALVLILLFPAIAHAQRKVSGPRTATLYVDAEPADAQVRLLEIKPKFKQGIALPAGNYVIDVQRKGYLTQYKQFRLTDGQTLRVKVTLQRDPAVPLPKDDPANPDAPGKLFVDIEPQDAAIRILDVSTRFAQGVELPAKTYSLDANRDGYETAVFSATVKPGEESRVSVTMTRTGETPAADAPDQPGTLVVEASPPDATIAVEGVDAPYASGMPLPPGQYTVAVEREGYTAVKKRVAIRPGKGTDIRVVLVADVETGEAPDDLTLPDNAGVLTANVEPADATLTLHGTELPFTQGMFLDQGEYTLEARRPGYTAQNATVSITSGQQTTVNIVLQEDSDLPPPTSSLLGAPPVKLVANEEAEGLGDNGALTLETDPRTDDILILNIKPKFEQGMELSPGKYRIEVRAEGYVSRRVRVEVLKGRSTTYRIVLEPAAPQATSLSKAPPEKAAQAQELLDEAQEFARNEQKQTALEKASQAVALDPGNPEAFRIRGSILRALKRFDLAVADYNRAIQLSSDEPIYYVERAVTLVEVGDVDSACYDFWKACSLGQCKPITMARTEGVCP